MNAPANIQRAPLRPVPIVMDPATRALLEMEDAERAFNWWQSTGAGDGKALSIRLNVARAAYVVAYKTHRIIEQ